MLNLETWIGLRYLRAKKRNGFMSFISVISIVGIALGVMTLIVVLSVMNGFQRDVRAKLFNVAPHMEIGYIDPEQNHNWQELTQLAAQKKHVLASTPYVLGQALLTNAGEVRGVMLQGIEPQSYEAVTALKSHLQAGSIDTLSAGEFNIVLGSGLAYALDAQIGNKVTVLTPQGNVTPAGMVPRLKQFNVVGIAHSGVYEMDENLALIDLNDAQKLFRMGDQVSGVRLKLDNPQDAPEMKAGMFPERQDLWVRDWSFQNQSYFEAVAMEKRMMFIIMAFISLVASFNLVSSLVMTVNEKRADIAILRTLGMSPRGVMRIFMVQGAIAGTLGTVIGVVLGVVIAWNIGSIVRFIENLVGRPLVQAQVYFLDYIPSDVQVSDVSVIAGISLLLAFLATLYPSYRAAKTEPAEALRYE
ncbi:MAG: lipoprotein-releasing ABC transporter permease subunit [Neisseria sp.]|nr:lipoprotein-releasing ABC transporter permease subunit [Neisseria sp.]